MNSKKVQFQNRRLQNGLRYARVILPEEKMSDNNGTTQKDEANYEESWFKRWGWIVLMIFLIIAAIGTTVAVMSSTAPSAVKTTEPTATPDYKATIDAMNATATAAAAVTPIVETATTAPTATPMATSTPAPTKTLAPSATATVTATSTVVSTTVVGIPPVVATTAEPSSSNEAIPCESIQVSQDGGKTWTSVGLALQTESVYDIGDRVTFTSRSVLVPNKAYNEALSSVELKTVENTWLDIKLNACKTEAVVFSYGFEKNNVKFDGGVLFNLKGEQQFRIKNGEVVLWYDQIHRDKDLGRIIGQVKVGNFDIKGPLAFAIADGLKDVKIIADYMTAHPGVKIVILP
jgi:cytoskeletal protein RodZ